MEDISANTVWPSDWRHMLGPAVQPPSPNFVATPNPHQAPVAALWGPAARVPYPTGTWWSNFVLGDGTLQVAALPYLLSARPSGLTVGGGAIQNNTPVTVSTSLNRGISLEAKESLTSRCVQSYDDLAVTLCFSGPCEASMTAPLLQGMPYVTALYAGASPVLAPQAGTCTISVSPPHGTAATRFTITTNAGMVWRVYTSQPVTFYNMDAYGTLAATQQYAHLVVRLALLTDASHQASLDAHSDVFPRGATVDWGYGPTSGSLRYSFDTSSMSDGPGERLMMMAWPHHMQVLESPLLAHPAMVVGGTLRGALLAVVGCTWTLHYPLSGISWTAPRGIAAARVAEVRASLLADATALPLDKCDAYYFGAQVAAAGRLILIAEELGDPASLTAAAALTERVKEAVTPWLLGRNPDCWRYDTTWGGLVPQQSLTCGRGHGFGAGVYNDHHFQSGYLIYGIAVLGRSDPHWLAQHRTTVLTLVRDYANPAQDDPFFPSLRHKDMWAGHSWANGLDVFADNRNQESTSEAVNAYYALQLLGEALGNDRLARFGATLAAMEMASTQHYWHMWSGRSVVGAPFSNNKVVGVLWSSKNDFLTWWSPNIEYICCIQMLPWTPLTEALLAPAAWLKELYPRLATTLTRADPPLFEAWRAFIFMAHAVLDPHAAWGELLTIRAFIDPNVATNTRTNALYWAATRPGA